MTKGRFRARAPTEVTTQTGTQSTAQPLLIQPYTQHPNLPLAPLRCLVRGAVKVAGCRHDRRSAVPEAAGEPKISHLQPVLGRHEAHVCYR
jgi:hypothetical protein